VFTGTGTTRSTSDYDDRGALTANAARTAHFDAGEEIESIAEQVIMAV